MPKPLKVTIRGIVVYSANYEEPAARALWHTHDVEMDLRNRAQEIAERAADAIAGLGSTEPSNPEDLEVWQLINEGGMSGDSSGSLAETVVPSGPATSSSSMPVSNSTIRKRRRGDFVIPTDESRSAKYAARCSSTVATATETMEIPMIATDEVEVPLTQMLEASMEQSEESIAAVQDVVEAAEVTAIDDLMDEDEDQKDGKIC